jgi:hypothetical protein
VTAPNSDKRSNYKAEVKLNVNRVVCKKKNKKKEKKEKKKKKKEKNNRKNKSDQYPMNN